MPERGGLRELPFPAIPVVGCRGFNEDSGAAQEIAKDFHLVRTFPVTRRWIRTRMTSLLSGEGETRQLHCPRGGAPVLGSPNAARLGAGTASVSEQHVRAIAGGHCRHPRHTR